jgi:hypothetical protein
VLVELGNGFEEECVNTVERQDERFHGMNEWRPLEKNGETDSGDSSRDTRATEIPNLQRPDPEPRE